MEMIKSRNETWHTYNEITADDIFAKVINHYHKAFLQFQQKMEGLSNDGQAQLFEWWNLALNKTIDAINQVFTVYPAIEKAVLYGSRAKGNYRDASDIDFTLMGKDLTFTLLAKIEADLDDLLLPYKIDLSMYDHIGNPELLDHVERVGEMFYQRKA